MTRESIRPQPHQDRAQVIVLCYPPEVVLRKNGKHYEKLWRIIIDLQGGGACAEERLRSLGGETIEDRFQIIAACLDSIEEDWKNDVYAKNMRASCSELGRGVEQDIQKARLGYLDAGNLGLPGRFL
ncbi:MAG: hypothetical protein IPL87_04745 [Candidatus Moraniibacteriota bacterium]|nr:MAG: hypothetical protein IPL87_04745 [Candidatus Moranbacteria bacterium]